MDVIKADGRKEKFETWKIVNTCLRAGVDKPDAEKIAEKIENSVKKGMTTHEIYQMILKELEKFEDNHSIVFRMREAISILDSESFELYVKEVLESNGYECAWNKLIMGHYVEHQIDIVAKDRKNRKTYLVECKRHTNPHRFTGLGPCLQVQARMEDVDDGFESGKNNTRFDSAWIVTNTKFSEHAKMYANGKKIMMTGWNYDKGIELERLIQKEGIYPITILGRDSEIKKLITARIVSVQGLLGSKYAKKRSMYDLVEIAKRLVS